MSNRTLTTPKPPIELNDQEFLAWLKAQPPEQEYEYIDGNNCAIAQFLRNKGVANPRVSSHLWGTEDYLYPLPIHWNVVAQGFLPFPFESFGNAAKRAERLFANQHRRTMMKMLENMSERQYLALVLVLFSFGVWLGLVLP